MRSGSENVTIISMTKPSHTYGTLRLTHAQSTRLAPASGPLAGASGWAVARPARERERRGTMPDIAPDSVTRGYPRSHSRQLNSRSCCPASSPTSSASPSTRSARRMTGCSRRAARRTTRRARRKGAASGSSASAHPSSRRHRSESMPTGISSARRGESLARPLLPLARSILGRGNPVEQGAGV